MQAVLDARADGAGQGAAAARDLADARGAVERGSARRVRPLSIDPLRLTVAWDGRAVSLTVTEILLLQGLVRRPGIVKTREQLMLDAYPDRVSVSDRTIDSHVKRIRRKFQAVDPAFDQHRGRLRRRLSLSRAVMCANRGCAASPPAAVAHRPPAARVQPAPRVPAGRRHPVSRRLRDTAARGAGARDGAAGPPRGGGAWRSGSGHAGRGCRALSRLGRRGDARIRIYDAGRAGGGLGARAGLAIPDRPSDEAASEYAKRHGIRERLLYRVGAWIVRVRRAAGRSRAACWSPSRSSPSRAMGSANLRPAPEFGRR